MHDIMAVHSSLAMQCSDAGGHYLLRCEVRSLGMHVGWYVYAWYVCRFDVVHVGACVGMDRWLSTTFTVPRVLPRDQLLGLASAARA